DEAASPAEDVSCREEGGVRTDAQVLGGAPEGQTSEPAKAPALDIPAACLGWLAQRLLARFARPRGRVAAALRPRQTSTVWVRPQGGPARPDEPVLIRRSAAADRPCGPQRAQNSRFEPPNGLMPLRAAIVLIFIAGVLLSAPVSAQTPPDPPGPYVVDLRGTTSRLPDTEFFPTRPRGTAVPSRGFGFDVGGHVYPLTTGGARVGLGVDLERVR